jgi:Ca2+-binding EF-hand superfamily protein
MDANKDGKLSSSEVQDPLKNNFTQIDKDKDGFITETKFNSAPPPPPRNRN